MKIQINICHKNSFNLLIGWNACNAKPLNLVLTAWDLTVLFFYFSASNNPPPPLVDLEGLNELFIVGGAGDVNLDAIDPWESGNSF